MKIELNLTQSQLDFLKDILSFKYRELDKEEDNILVCRDFSLEYKDIEEYERLIECLKTQISDIKLILHQLANNIVLDQFGDRQGIQEYNYP